jgi:hypothetical protein
MRNPVRAHSATSLKQYQWSSARLRIWCLSVVPTFPPAARSQRLITYFHATNRMNANSLPALEPCRLYLDESNLALNSNQFKACPRRLPCKTRIASSSAKPRIFRLRSFKTEYGISVGNRTTNEANVRAVPNGDWQPSRRWVRFFNSARQPELGSYRRIQISTERPRRWVRFFNSARQPELDPYRRIQISTERPRRWVRFCNSVRQTRNRIRFGECIFLETPRVGFVSSNRPRQPKLGSFSQNPMSNSLVWLLLD